MRSGQVFTHTCKAPRGSGPRGVEWAEVDAKYRRLVPRSEPGAVITDPAEAARRAVQLALSGRVRSLCVHGDTPGAVTMARRVRAELEAAGLAISPFA